MFPFGPERIIVKLERVPVIDLGIRRGQTSRKESVAADEYLGGIEPRKRTKGCICNGRVERCRTNRATLEIPVKTETGRIDQDGAKSVSFRDGRKGAAGSRIYDLVVEFIGGAYSGPVTEECAAELIVGRKTVIGT